LVQNSQGKVGEVVGCLKKDEDGELVSGSSVSKLTTLSGNPPANSANTATGISTEPLENGEATIPADIHKVYCPKTHRVGDIVSGEPWEGRLWVVWPGKAEPEAVLRTTLWKVGDRLFDTIGNPCKIVGFAPPDFAKVKWEENDRENYIIFSKLSLVRPHKKPEAKPAEPNPNLIDLHKLIEETQSVLESAGYEWEIEELLTKFPEVKIKAIASGNTVGEVHFFPKEMYEEYYPDPEVCFAGGIWKNYFWAISPELYDSDCLVREIEEIAISSVNLWQVVDLPLDDINFRHYVGRQLIMQNICHDYKIDSETLSLFVPHDSNLSAAHAVVSSIMKKVNNYQRDIPAKGSDRISQLKLFPWEEAD